MARRVAVVEHPPHEHRDCEPRHLPRWIHRGSRPDPRASVRHRRRRAHRMDVRDRSAGPGGRQATPRRPAREHGRTHHGQEHVRAGPRCVGPGLDRVVGARAALPRTGVRAHPPPERPPLPMQGGTTFTFVVDGIESALDQARQAGGGKPIEIAGGAAAVRQYLAAGLLDELVLHLVPAVLDAGERLLDGLGGLSMTPVEVIASPHRHAPPVPDLVLRVSPSGAGRSSAPSRCRSWSARGRAPVGGHSGPRRGGRRRGRSSRT